MSAPSHQAHDQVRLRGQQLQSLIETLHLHGYRVMGPKVAEGAIVYDELASAEELPAGWTDEQKGGSYRLVKRNDSAAFGYTLGPHSWKKYLHPAVLRMWTAKREGHGFEIPEETLQVPKLAFLGVRACELHAIAIQDKVLTQGTFRDPSYSSRRENVFIVAVNCTQPGGTCFCESMGTGPQATFGFDLALTEIHVNGQHDFLVEAGTVRGTELLHEVPHEKATEEEKKTAAEMVAGAAQHMGRRLDTHEIKELLYRSHEHPRWDEVAERCLNCANCTMVCPTCFCTTVEDVTDLAGTEAQRWRKWDSCFTSDFSYIHGGSVRASRKSRYRQWLTHKLATWIDQFGSSGCVGCGRCITWCPVAIDLTEEVLAIRQAGSTDSAALSTKEEQ